MTAFTAFSQTSYPRAVVIDGDTVEAISRPQMRQLIAQRYALDECDSDRSIVSAQVAKLASVSYRQDSAARAAQEEVQGYDAEVRLLNSRIVNKDDELTVNKKLMKLQTRNSTAGGIVGSLAAIAAGIGVGFLTHK